jgi:hypothetical protein
LGEGVAGVEGVPVRLQETTPSPSRVRRER